MRNIFIAFILCVIQIKTLGAMELPSVFLKSLSAERALELATLRDKTVVINFFASWCTSCIKELPELEALKKAHPEATFLAVNAGESPVIVKKFLHRYPFSYQVFLDPERALAKRLRVEELPRTMVFRQGALVYNAHTPPRIGEPGCW